MRTTNRRPIQIDLPKNDGRIDNFNIIKFEGIVDTENDLTVSSSSLSDSNNMYINEDEVLSSRPALKIDTNQFNGTIKKTWVVDDLMILEVVDNFNIRKLRYVKNGILLNNYLVLSNEINCLESIENYLLIYPENKYVNLTNNYSSGSIYDIMYVPTTELRSGTEVSNPEKKNVLSPYYKKSIIYNRELSTDLTQFNNLNIEVETSSTTYDINNFTTRQSVAIYNDICSIPEGAVIKYSKIGSAVYYYNEEVYYAADGKNFVYLAHIPFTITSGIDVYIFISDTGDSVYVTRDMYGGMYALSLLNTVWNSSLNVFTKKWSDWTQIGLSSNYDRYMSITDNGSSEESIDDERTIDFTTVSSASTLISPHFANIKDDRNMTFCYGNRVHTIVNDVTKVYQLCYKRGSTTYGYNVIDILVEDMTLFVLAYTHDGYRRLLSFRSINTSSTSDISCYFYPAYSFVDPGQGTSFRLNKMSTFVYGSMYYKNSYIYFLSRQESPGSTGSDYSLYYCFAGVGESISANVYKITDNYYVSMLDYASYHPVHMNDTYIYTKNKYFIKTTVNSFSSYDYPFTSYTHMLGGDGNNYYFLLNNTVISNVGAVATISSTYTDSSFVLPTIKHSSKMTDIFFNDDKNLYIGKELYDKNENLKLYFSSALWEEFDESIFYTQILSSNSLGVYCRDSVWVVYSDDSGAYYKLKSKIATSCRSGDNLSLSLTGEGSLYPCNRGIAYISHQSMLSIQEQKLEFISDDVQTYITKWLKDIPVKLFTYSFWLYAYSSQSNEMWIMDLRDNTWWKWTLPTNVEKMFVYLDEVYLLCTNNCLCKFTTDGRYEDVYDLYNLTKTISWSFSTQRLFLSDINRYKHISGVVLNNRCPDDNTTQNKYIKLSCLIYRNSISRTPTDIINYKVEGIRSFFKKLNIYKCNFIKINLSSDDENYHQEQMKIEGLTIKYGIRERIR